MNRIILPGVLLVLLTTPAHADKLVGGHTGSNQQEACERAKNTAAEKIAQKGKEVKGYGECSCTSKNTFTVLCKVDGYFDGDTTAEKSAEKAGK